MNKQTECLKIYREAFGDEEPDFTDLLFKTCFKNCVFLEFENNIVSMFFALPCEIATKTENIPAIYIYAAATDKNFRGQGFMTKLLENYKSVLSEDAVLFLRPANDGLIKFYENSGFKEICGVNDNLNFPRVTPIDSFAYITNDITLGGGEEFTLMYYSKSGQNIEKLHFIYSME